MIFDWFHFPEWNSMRGIESVIIVSFAMGFLHPQNWEWGPSDRRGGPKGIDTEVSILLDSSL